MQCRTEAWHEGKKRWPSPGSLGDVLVLDVQRGRCSPNISAWQRAQGVIRWPIFGSVPHRSNPRQVLTEQRSARWGFRPSCLPWETQTNPNVGRPKQLPLLRLFKLQPGGTCSRMWERARAGAWHVQLFLPVLFFQPIQHAFCTGAWWESGPSAEPDGSNWASSFDK